LHVYHTPPYFYTPILANLTSFLNESVPKSVLGLKGQLVDKPIIIPVIQEMKPNP